MSPSVGKTTDFSIQAIIGDTGDARKEDAVNFCHQVLLNEVNSSSEEEISLQNLEDNKPGKDNIDENESERPLCTYAVMIRTAIQDSPNQKLTLQQIYEYLQNKFPYFRNNPPGWRNSVRHTLSLNRWFTKIPRSYDDPGRGNYWGLRNSIEGDIRKLGHQNIDYLMPAIIPGNYSDAYFVGGQGSFCHLPIHDPGLISAPYNYTNPGHFGIPNVRSFPGMSLEEFQHNMCMCGNSQNVYHV